MANANYAQKRRGSSASPAFTAMTSALWRRLQEGSFIVLTALAIFLFVALITYNDGDPGWSKTTSHKIIARSRGPHGA